MSERKRLATDTENGLLLIISGPSGVGKTTLTRGVERSIADAIFSVSVTTREKTAADVEGVDYRFVGRNEFQRMIDAGELLEHAKVYGKLYGTPRKWVEEQRNRGRVVILEIDVHGAGIVKRAMPSALSVFILPPNEETLFTRLNGRGREPEEAIRRRFDEATKEIAAARTGEFYDAFVVNDDLDRAIAEVIRLVEGARRSEASAEQAAG